MKPSSVARRKRATDRSFVAIDFETAHPLPQVLPADPQLPGGAADGPVVALQHLDNARPLATAQIAPEIGIRGASAARHRLESAQEILAFESGTVAHYPRALDAVLPDR